MFPFHFRTLLQAGPGLVALLASVVLIAPLAKAFGPLPPCDCAHCQNAVPPRSLLDCDEASSAATPCDEASGAPEPCDATKRADLRRQAAGAYKGLFYANDFRYLNDPCYDGNLLGESLKQLDFHGGKLDLGGQYRMRYHRERGMNKGPFQRFLPTDDNFLLQRLRLYGNYQMNEDIRVFVEGIFAESSFQSLPVRPIDVNHGDFLNAFVDLRATENMTFRAGRQELLYGNQRLVSPLDWANTRRTFEGMKLLWNRDDWQADAFWTAVVPVRRYEMDRADWTQQFYGTYAVYSGWENKTLDLFYLGYDDRREGFSLHTYGGRLFATEGDWLYEVEGGYQGGNASDAAAGPGRSHSAGFATVGLGRNLSRMPWDMTLWGYFDYASGDFPGGSYNNFNHLFPLGHKYLGYIDAVQRTNILSPNLLWTMNPTERWNLLFWYYIFQSDSPAPVPSIGGTPAQNTRRRFGQELDVLATYRMSPRSELQLGWSHLWRGSKIDNPSDADFVYVQWMLNF